MLECDIVSVAFGLLLPSLVSLANAHPQCLDFLPPFEGASGYCTASSEQEKDKKVRQYLRPTFPSTFSPPSSGAQTPFLMLMCVQIRLMTCWRDDVIVFYIKTRSGSAAPARTTPLLKTVWLPRWKAQAMKPVRVQQCTGRSCVGSATRMRRTSMTQNRRMGTLGLALHRTIVKST